MATSGCWAQQRTCALPQDLPEVLARHLDPRREGRVPGAGTAVFTARGRVRRGPLTLPIRMITRHQIGRSFVSDIDVGILGLSVVHVVDAYVDGRGITVMGRTGTLGPEIDQAACLFLWSEAVLVPAAFAAGGPVVARSAGADEVELGLPFGAETLTAVLSFQDGRPRRFSAQRFKLPGQPKVGWSVDYLAWRDGHEVPLPTRVEVTWADESRPWLRATLTGLALDADVAERIEEVRALLP